MRIPGRFNGPPASGHGGYTAGLIAAHVPEPVVAVSLRSPVPLDRELEIRSASGGVEVFDGDALIATAAPSPPPAAPPPGLSPAAAAAAARDGDAIVADHPYPTCYGCGPLRTDGLRLFAGPVGDGRYAALWTPAPAAPAVPDELVWAALDCPSAEPVADPPGGAPIVLARFVVVCERPVPGGEPTALVARALDSDGRKRRSTVALYDERGTRLAHGEALWIALRSRRPKAVRAFPYSRGAEGARKVR